jgi:hypothetical protein
MRHERQLHCPLAAGTSTYLWSRFAAPADREKAIATRAGDTPRCFGFPKIPTAAQSGRLAAHKISPI